MSATTPALELRGVSKVHTSPAGDVHALRDVDLTVHPGELVAVMGPSGSGKSTLLNMAGGLDAPTSGDVIVGGASIVGIPQKRMAKLRRSSIGFVFQDLNLVPALTADEPTGALDSVTGEEVLMVLRDRCDAGAAVVDVVGETPRAPREVRDGHTPDDQHEGGHRA